MAYTPTFTLPEPSSEQVQALHGWTLLEFGTDWCPHCQGAQGAIRDALASLPDVQHIKIEDGPGRRLGRAYRVKLWPTLVLLHNGQEAGRTIRPRTTAEVQELLAPAQT